MKTTKADKALDAIHRLMDAREWDADTLDSIADIIRATGREIRDCSEGDEDNE